MWNKSDPDLIITTSNGSGCPTSPTVYGQGASVPAWWQYPTGFTSRRWVLEINNEVSWSDENPGPPDLSYPRSEPGSGVMGFKMIKDIPAGENFFRAHLVSNELENCGNVIPTNNCDKLLDDIGHISFMTIGAASNRGNGQLITKLNDSSQKHKVRFVAKLWAYVPFSDHGEKRDELNPDTNVNGAIFQMLVTAKWAGKPRGLFISLFHDGVLEYSGTDSNPNGQKTVWNWPLQESYFYPGGEFAYLDAEDMWGLCGMNIPRINNVGEQRTYTIDLRAAFQCASDLGLYRAPMPQTTPIKVFNISWGNEWFGTRGAFWTSVHDIRLVN